MPIVIGTAGHVDHGKTSLIKALTGTDCDRLVEEKKRGITIELGFSFLPRPKGGVISIIDVPGHERFVKNMVSGTAGIDCILLIIAADEGIMPQTREHLEICSLLGIKSGLVVITKTDMVDEEWLKLVTEEVQAFVKDTFLENAPVFSVSSRSGQGIEELKQAIIDISYAYEPRRRSDLPRLPVDRVFIIKGHGTVVTGTLISGSFKVGEQVELYPSGKTSKVRMLQSHGQAEDKAAPGYRTAVNLATLETTDVNKGDVVSLPKRLFPASSWVINLHCLPSAPRALRHRMEVHFHHGAAEAQAKLIFYDRDKLHPGETAIAKIQFAEPMAGVFGDRFVIRSYSPLQTVAGGEVVHPLDLTLKKRDKNFARTFELLQDTALKLFDDDTTSPLLNQLELAGTTGVTFNQLCVLLNSESTLIEKSLQALGAQQLVFMVDKEERRYLSAVIINALSASCLQWFEAYHQKEHLKSSLNRNAVMSGWGKKLHPKTVHFIIRRLTESGVLTAEGEALRLASHAVALDASESKLRENLLQAYVSAGMTPPNFKEVLEQLGIDSKKALPVMKLLLESKELTNITEGVYYDTKVLALLQRNLLGWFDKNREITPADFRDLTGLSRKYCIYLLEYFDKIKMTMRVGDARVLRSPVQLS